MAYREGREVENDTARFAFSLGELSKERVKPL
jgi:hypothetical protein